MTWGEGRPHFEPDGKAFNFPNKDLLRSETITCDDAQVIDGLIGRSHATEKHAGKIVPNASPISSVSVWLVFFSPIMCPDLVLAIAAVS
jgi:hypothetical protein